MHSFFAPSFHLFGALDVIHDLVFMVRMPYSEENHGSILANWMKASKALKWECMISRKMIAEMAKKSWRFLKIYLRSGMTKLKEMMIAAMSFREIDASM
jgi:hypothetical protein